MATNNNLNSELDQHILFLKDEVDYLYKKIFFTTPPRPVVKNYIEANLKLIPDPDRNIRKLVLKEADVEAVELAWRNKSPGNVLTQKFHILIYLIETNPENSALFFNEENRRIYSYIEIGCHLIRSLVKSLKGKYLLKRYHLA